MRSSLLWKVWQTQRKRPKRHAPTKARESLNNKGEINVAQLLAMTSELHPWRFELEFFSKSVTLWTPLKKIFFDLYAELRSALVLSVTYFDDAQLRSTLAHACTTLYAVYKPNLDNKQYLITALAVLSVPAITRLTLTPPPIFFFLISQAMERLCTLPDCAVTAVYLLSVTWVPSLDMGIQMLRSGLTYSVLLWGVQRPWRTTSWIAKWRKSV